VESGKRKERAKEKTLDEKQFSSLIFVFALYAFSFQLTN